MKKLTKFLPLAMAMFLVSPAFAAETSDSSTMVLTVPEFISIKKTSSVEAADASFDADYTTLTASKAMNANFHVITNLPNKMIYLKGTCAASDSADAPALYETTGSDQTTVLNLVFANETVKPSLTDVSNITGGTTSVESNANAIAFTLTPSFTYDANTGAQAPITTSEVGKISYKLQNGVYDISYTLGTQALAGTFSTKDTKGIYKAKLVLTDANP